MNKVKEQARLRKQRQRERDKQRDTVTQPVTPLEANRVTPGVTLGHANVTVDVTRYCPHCGGLLDETLPDTTESMLGAVNVVLGRKGLPKVQKGVMLPFDKRLQASRKRM